MADIRKFYWRLAGVFGGGLVLALVVFGGVVPLVGDLGKPAYLDILVEPAAKVEIGGAEYANAIYEMEPGAYTAKVSLNGAVEEVDLDLVRGRTTGVYMRWTEDGGWRYYTAEELKHREEIGTVMPVNTAICGVPATRVNCDAITVTYERAAGCGGEKCLVISGRREELTDEVLTEVRERLSELGYDLSDYRYIYTQNFAT